MILEDDVFFEAEFAEQLNRTWQELPKNHSNAPKFDVLYVSFREVERGAQRIACSPNLVRPLNGYWWLSGYVLSNAGARKLLESLPVIGPVDLWMNHCFAKLDVYSTPSSVISQRTDLQSDNRYSILPLLSQIGVQTDRTHLVLEQTRGRRPVFCVGFGPKTSTILESALSLLAYRCCNDRWGQHSANVGRLLEENRPLLFDAYVRVDSISKQLAKVGEMYPGSAFIFRPR
jgi:GR25 family glycosyltransferase involved in LPS biosynthesis